MKLVFSKLRSIPTVSLDGRFLVLVMDSLFITICVWRPSHGYVRLCQDLTLGNTLSAIGEQHSEEQKVDTQFPCLWPQI
jgi:hypothetical protein